MLRTYFLVKVYQNNILSHNHGMHSDPKNLAAFGPGDARRSMDYDYV